MSKKTYFQYTPPTKTAWDELPMNEKADIMKSCVRNGIISLQDVRTAYNNYAAGRNILEGIPDYQANAAEFGNFLAGGGRKNSEEKVRVHQPYYAYDENGKKIDDILYYNVNVTLPEVTIIPDNMKSPAQRNADERFRQRFNRNYAEQQARDYTTRQSIAAQRKWENSPQKKALDLGIAAAQGIGMASDVVSPFFGGIPVYSGLKGAQALDRATSTNDVADYADAALWLSPMLIVAGKRIYDTAKPVVHNIFQKGTPATKWVREGSINASYLDGEPEIGMYFPDGKTFNTKAFAQDLVAGIADARLFLGSEVKKASDVHNIELAKRIGLPQFMPYAKAQERASIYVKPQLTVNKSAMAGSVEKNTDNPALDKMTINVLYDADKGGFHETLHRGNYGEAGYFYDPKTMDFMPYHQIQDDTRGLYDFKTKKLLVPKTEENAEWHDYMSRSAEAATNSMELGRRMGLKPGAPWPGRKKAMELFEKYASSEDQKTKAFNVLNWRQKPRRIWDALTGRYFVLGAGTLSTTSLIDN